MHTLHKRANVIFRVQTNNVGFGHVKRCISLAQAFRSKDVHCLFIINQNEPAQLFLHEWETIAIKAEQEFWAYVSMLQTVHHVIVDGDFVDVAYIDRLRLYEYVQTITIVDVNRQGLLGADFLINTAPYAMSLYKDIERAFVGPRYTIVDDVLLTAPTYACQKPLIVISLGGTLYQNHNDFFIQLARQLPMYDFVIIGPSHIYNEHFIRHNVTYFPQLPNIFSYLKAASLAIIGGGTTIYEAVALNKRCIVIPLNDAQKEAAAWWHEQEYVMIFEEVLQEGHIATYINTALQSVHNTKEIVNINGKHIIVEQILNAGAIT